MTKAIIRAVQAARRAQNLRRRDRQASTTRRDTAPVPQETGSRQQNPLMVGQQRAYLTQSREKESGTTSYHRSFIRHEAAVTLIEADTWLKSMQSQLKQLPDLKQITQLQYALAVMSSLLQQSPLFSKITLYHQYCTVLANIQNEMHKLQENLRHPLCAADNRVRRIVAFEQAGLTLLSDAFLLGVSSDSVLSSDWWIQCQASLSDLLPPSLVDDEMVRHQRRLLLPPDKQHKAQYSPIRAMQWYFAHLIVGDDSSKQRKLTELLECCQTGGDELEQLYDDIVSHRANVAPAGAIGGAQSLSWQPWWQTMVGLAKLRLPRDNNAPGVQVKEYAASFDETKTQVLQGLASASEESSERTTLALRTPAERSRSTRSVSENFTLEKSVALRVCDAGSAKKVNCTWLVGASQEYTFQTEIVGHPAGHFIRTPSPWRDHSFWGYVKRYDDAEQDEQQRLRDELYVMLQLFHEYFTRRQDHEEVLIIEAGTPHLAQMASCVAYLYGINKVRYEGYRGYKKNWLDARSPSTKPMVQDKLFTWLGNILGDDSRFRELHQANLNCQKMTMTLLQQVINNNSVVARQPAAGQTPTMANHPMSPISVVNSTTSSQRSRSGSDLSSASTAPILPLVTTQQHNNTAMMTQLPANNDGVAQTQQTVVQAAQNNQQHAQAANSSAGDVITERDLISVNDETQGNARTPQQMLQARQDAASISVPNANTIGNHDSNQVEPGVNSSRGNILKKIGKFFSSRFFSSATQTQDTVEMEMQHYFPPRARRTASF